MEVIDYKVVSVFSEERTNGIIENFTVYNNVYNIEDHPPDHVLRVMVLKCSIPHSYYIVGSNNDKIHITENDGINPVTQYDVTLKHGNYNIIYLLNEISTQLQTLSTLTWTLNFDRITQKVTITTVETVTITFDFTLTENTAHELLGFTKGTFTVTNPTPLISDSVVRLTGIDHLYIRSNIANTNSIHANLKGNTKVLLGLPVDAKAGELITYHAYSDFDAKILYNTKSITAFTLQLTDKHGNIIDLNKQNYDIELLFQVVRIKK